MNEPESIKVVLIGESGVGKTSIISQFTTNKFPQSCQPSVNSQFVSKTLEFQDYDKSLKFEIWDTVGQEKYRALAKLFYRDADVIIYVYDITSSLSFEAIRNFWYPETMKNAINNPLFAIVANKYDLYIEGKMINNEGKKFAKEIKAIYIQTSAMSNMGINDLFHTIGNKIIDPEYEINYNYINLFESENQYKKYKENELKSIKSNRTNKTYETDKTNKTNKTNKTKKTNKLLKLETIKENGEEKKKGNRKKKCC